MGPLALADFIGLDVCKDIMEVLHEGFGEERFRPPRVLVDHVEAGHLGQKTGPRLPRVPAWPRRGRRSLGRWRPDEIADRPRDGLHVERLREEHDAARRGEVAGASGSGCRRS